MTAEIPDWMIIDAVRYATGRMTYQVSTTTAWLIQNWSSLSEYTQKIVRADLEREFTRDDTVREMSSNGIYPLGADCDRGCWESVRRLWQEPKENTDES